ncbi:hypothetical protein CHC_T00008643001 [Chondrus crispus]|uniref:Uncharacterized protein n=1 Tax=Chondrus crispus TaxID=2769 RepID=R7QT90_CHOCR|nr:hypothetical protein CHC_T00008643001 [Chondrus crispus]CDF40575.1 hypothetical protein CHC_T00008643001 [Chondrus crispus]|eukprot:XP_005710869.1 hypothetical protein CHC_T00008643001 [Chondrus crispus]
MRWPRMAQEMLIRENQWLAVPESDATYAPSEHFEVRKCLQACGIDTSKEVVKYNDIEQLVELVTSRKVKHRGRSFLAEVNNELLGIEVSDQCRIEVTLSMVTDPDSKLFPYGPNVFEDEIEGETLKLVLLRDDVVRKIIGKGNWLKKLSSLLLPSSEGVNSNLMAEVVAILAREADFVARHRGYEGCLITAIYGGEAIEKRPLMSDRRMKKRYKGTLIVDAAVPLRIKLVVGPDRKAYGTIAGRYVLIENLPLRYSKSRISHVEVLRGPGVNERVEAASKAAGITTGMYQLQLDGRQKDVPARDTVCCTREEEAREWNQEASAADAGSKARKQR